MIGYFAFAGVAAVLLVLALGVGRFAFGSHDPRRSNRLMRLRVVAQAVAILALLAALAIGSAD